ncbi:MAG: hypothetical protein GXP05_06095 [Alphaproteobacteria bacterium]|nr:hypothetical protein [Alphaproteobacteria bacterium]
MFNPYNVYKILSGIIGVFALLKSFQIIMGCPYAEFVQYLVDGYSEIVSMIFGYVEPALRFISLRFFKFDLILGEHWRHILIFLSLYYSAEIRTDLSRNPSRPINTGVNIVLGPTITIVTAVFLGLVPLNSEQINWTVVLAAPAGFLVFAASATMLTTTFYRPSHQNWPNSFYYNLKSTMLPYISIYTLSVVVAAVVTYSTTRPLSSIISIPTFMLLASIWWLRRGIRLASNDRESHESWAKRFFRAGSTKLALNVIIVISVASVIAIASSCLT